MCRRRVVVTGNYSTPIPVLEPLTDQLAVVARGRPTPMEKTAIDLHLRLNGR
jgi:hypothetical protein